MEDKFLLTLGLVQRAGKLSFRTDVIADDIEIGNAKLVIASGDVKNIRANRIYALCSEYDVKIIKVTYGKKELGFAIGRGGTEFIGIRDKGFAKKLIEVATSIGGLVIDDDQI